MALLCQFVSSYVKSVIPTQMNFISLPNPVSASMGLIGATVQSVLPIAGNSYQFGPSPDGLGHFRQNTDRDVCDLFVAFDFRQVFKMIYELIRLASTLTGKCWFQVAATTYDFWLEFAKIIFRFNVEGLYLFSLFLTSTYGSAIRTNTKVHNTYKNLVSSVPAAVPGFISTILSIAVVVVMYPCVFSATEFLRVMRAYVAGASQHTVNCHVTSLGEISNDIATAYNNVIPLFPRKITITAKVTDTIHVYPNDPVPDKAAKVFYMMTFEARCYQDETHNTYTDEDITYFSEDPRIRRFVDPAMHSNKKVLITKWYPLRYKRFSLSLPYFGLCKRLPKVLSFSEDMYTDLTIAKTLSPQETNLRKARLRTAAQVLDFSPTTIAPGEKSLYKTAVDLARARNRNLTVDTVSLMALTHDYMDKGSIIDESYWDF